MDRNKQPLEKVSVRVHDTQAENRTLVTQCQTNHEGMSKLLALEAPAVMLSYDRNQPACPYSRYDVEVSKDGYDTEERLNVQIFPNIASTLTIMMHACAKQSLRNTMDLGEHSLYPQGDQDA